MGVVCAGGWTGGAWGKGNAWACAVVGVSVLALVQPAPEAEATPPVTEMFSAAHAHFLRGRELQHLHRNTEESRREFAAAYEGYRAVVTGAPKHPTAPRAQYMAGSATLFLGESAAAIAAYQEVIDRYASDRAYLAKALVRKAVVEADFLDPAAARRTLEEYRHRFADGGDPAQDKEASKLARALELIGQPAPAIAAARWLGAKTPGAETLRGRVSLLYFFATWCPNCRKEVDFINDLSQRFTPKGVRLIGITNHSRGQTNGDVERYIAEHGLAFPVAVDRDGTTSRAFSGGSVPTAVLVDRSGVIRWHDHPAALADAVLERLAGAPVSEAAR